MSYMDHWWAMHEMTWYLGFWGPPVIFFAAYIHTQLRENN